MTLRLRQIALVAEQLAPLEAAIGRIFGLAPCYRDPAVAEFGLENVLFPLGNQFLEIVAPTRSGTAAGRYLERRHGDGGYMVITQCDEHAAYRERAGALGVRIAHEFVMPDFLNMQLHPRDTGGTFFEIDEQLGLNAGDSDGPWAPAGPGWRDYVRTERVRRIAAVEIQCEEPQKVAARWAALADCPLLTGGGPPELRLDNAAIRFVPCADGRPEGLAGLDLIASDADAVLDAAKQSGLIIRDAGFSLAGMRWQLC